MLLPHFIIMTSHFLISFQNVTNSKSGSETKNKSLAIITAEQLRCSMKKVIFGNFHPDSFWSFSISFRICTLVISKFYLKVLYVAECKVPRVFKKEKETKVRQSIATKFNFDRDRHELGECYSRSIISVSVFLVSSYVTCFLAHVTHTLL